MKIELINLAAGQLKSRLFVLREPHLLIFSLHLSVGMSTYNTAGPDARETVSLRVEAAHLCQERLGRFIQ